MKVQTTPSLPLFYYRVFALVLHRVMAASKGQINDDNWTDYFNYTTGLLEAYLPSLVGRKKQEAAMGICQLIYHRKMQSTPVIKNMNMLGGSIMITLFLYNPIIRQHEPVVAHQYSAEEAFAKGILKWSAFEFINWFNENPQRTHYIGLISTKGRDIGTGDLFQGDGKRVLEYLN